MNFFRTFFNKKTGKQVSERAGIKPRLFGRTCLPEACQRYLAPIPWQTLHIGITLLMMHCQIQRLPPYAFVELFCCLYLPQYAMAGLTGSLKFNSVTMTAWPSTLTFSSDPHLGHVMTDSVPGAERLTCRPHLRQCVGSCEYNPVMIFCAAANGDLLAAQPGDLVDLH